MRAEKVLDSSVKPSLNTLFGLQYYRGIAASLVVVSHISAMSSFTKYFNKEIFSGIFSFTKPNHIDLGIEAVYLFFVLSGFIMVYVSLTPLLKPLLTLKNFLIKRVIRIIPFMWFTIFLYAIFKWIGNNEFPFKNYISALFLFPFQNNIEPKQIWTLTHEFLFYGLFGILFLKLRRFNLILIIWFSASLIYLFFDITDPILKFIFSKYNILFGLGFLTGILVKKLKTDLIKLKSYPIVTLAAISIAFLLIIFFRQFLNNDMLQIIWSGTVFSILIGFASLFTISNDSKLHSLLNKLGDASFSIYLTHGICLSAMLKMWSKLQPLANLYVVLFVVTLITLAVGYIIHIKIEKKILILFKGKDKAH